MSFVHLHNHTDYSALDGLTFPREAARRAADCGQPALAITDHGLCAGHPQHQRECEKAGIAPVFGMEGYWVPDRRVRPASGDKEAQKRRRAYKHIILLARGDQGLRDLWALSTEAYATGLYHKPCCDDELLERYGSDLIVTSSCLGGLVSKEALAGDIEAAAARLMRLRDMLPGRFYLEIQGNALPEQRRLNLLLAELGDILRIPLVAASDAHYPDPAHKDLHRLWMSCQTSPANDSYWNYIHMQTEQEVRDALGYLDGKIVEEAIRNTGLIAEQCTARIGGIADPPHFTSSHDEDARMLLDLCMRALPERGLAGSPAHADRLEREFRLVTDKHLAGCYLIVHDVINFARSKGILPGPGRGSAAGSLMSYLLRITSMEPIATGLMFERFVTPGRTSLPDFDMDFPSSSRTLLQDYVTGKYGSEHVVRVGTHMRYRSKAVLNKLFSVMRPDIQDDPPRVASIIDEAESHTAGLGMPWDQLMEETADQMAEFVSRYGEVFEAAAHLVGRLNSYGQHPAGLVISPSAELASELPMRTDEKKTSLISQWDFRDLDALGLLKLDFLTLRTLDSIQESIRLIGTRTARPPDPLEWDAEHTDPQAWDEICAGNTLGMFQIETSLGRDFCRRMKPRSLADLGALISLVRPGPRNSGMAEAYLRRRAGTEEITYPHPLLESYLQGTYGLMIYQEDILNACRVLAGYDDAEADAVRKILGKKLTEKLNEAGNEFIRRCWKHSHIGHEEASHIWDLMEKFGKYGFNRAHAYAYAILSFWTAWLKAHYPIEAITGILSTLDKKDRMADFAVDARRIGIAVLPPDVRISGAGFSAEGLAIRYGLSSIKGLGPSAITSIRAGQPYATLDDFLARSKADSGVVYALARAGALDPLIPTRRGLVSRLEADRSGDATRCIHKDERITGAPNGLPCAFDWAAEPQPEPRTGRSGKPLKVTLLQPPKRCTRACRHYTPPALSFDRVPEYAAPELWRLENDIYGTWMTPAAFEALDRIEPGLRAHARSAALLLPDAPRGSYLITAVADGSRSMITRKGSVMYWLWLATEISTLRVAVFQPRDDEPDLPAALRILNRGTLVIAGIAKDSYVTPSGQPRVSWRLESIAPLKGLLSAI